MVQNKLQCGMHMTLGTVLVCEEDCHKVN